MIRVGRYTLRVVNTGTFGLDGGAMFGVVPKPLWERRIPADERNRIPLAMRCLLLEDSDRLILIDNGIGDKSEARFQDLYRIEFESGSLDRSLDAAGFSRTDITDVILTHLHFDHCGGSTVRTGGRLDVAFPNAVFHVQQLHWVTANAPNPRERASFLSENLEPLASSGQLRLIDGNTELFPDVSVRTVDGHTDKMQMVIVKGDEGTLVYAADLLPTRHHLASAWTMAYDMRPLQTIHEKSAFLAEAHSRGWHIFFEHDPDVEIASLAESEKGVHTVDERSLRELY